MMKTVADAIASATASQRRDDALTRILDIDATMAFGDGDGVAIRQYQQASEVWIAFFIGPIDDGRNSDIS